MTIITAVSMMPAIIIQGKIGFMEAIIYAMALFYINDGINMCIARDGKKRYAKLGLMTAVVSWIYFIILMYIEYSDHAKPNIAHIIFNVFYIIIVLVYTFHFMELDGTSNDYDKLRYDKFMIYKITICLVSIISAVIYISII